MNSVKFHMNPVASVQKVARKAVVGGLLSCGPVEENRVSKARDESVRLPFSLRLKSPKHRVGTP